MKKVIAVFCSIAFFTSCQQKNEKTETVSVTDTVKKKSNFQMYEMSEMATLMEQMYAYNTQLRERIINNEQLGNYPVAFDKLHTAILTDASDRDSFFTDKLLSLLWHKKPFMQTV